MNMKKIILTGAVCGMVAAAGVSEVVAAEASVGADLASSYVFRGGTLNDGFVVQPYAEVAVIEGLTIGTWANFDIDDDDANGIEGGHFSEIDLYVGYDLPLPEDSPVGLSVGYTEYTYPHAGGTVNADGTTVTAVDADREISLSTGLDTILAPSLGVFYGVDGGIDGDLYIEGSVSHEVEISEDVSGSVDATLGYLDPDVGDSGFSHAKLGAGVSYGPATLSVAYIIETDDKVLVVDEEIVGTLGFGWDI